MSGFPQWPSVKGRLGAPNCTRYGKCSPPQWASPVLRLLTEGHWGFPRVLMERSAAAVSRRAVVTVLCVMTLLLGEAPTLHAGEAVVAVAITPDQVVDRGLAALVKMQQADGSFGEGAGITALAGMALLSGGHTPTRGRYHEASQRALRAVLAKRDRVSGYLGADMGNMYSHGFAALYLAECYGMAPAEPVRAALESAIDLIHQAQNREGGWRYSPVPDDADISVTICQVMALRAANNVGIGGKATEDAIRKAIAYVRRCANPDGSFNYMISGGGWGTSGPEGVPRAAAGAMSLIGAGIHETSDPQLGPALRFLNKQVVAHLKGQGDYYWYGQYYASQALFHSPNVEEWDRYWKEAWPIIARKQGRDGLWTEGEGPGPAYATSMALIILQIPNQYLPIFQR